MKLETWKLETCSLEARGGSVFTCFLILKCVLLFWDKIGDTPIWSDIDINLCLTFSVCKIELNWKDNNVCKQEELKPGE